MFVFRKYFISAVLITSMCLFTACFIDSSDDEDNPFTGVWVRSDSAGNHLEYNEDGEDFDADGGDEEITSYRYRKYTDSNVLGTYYKVVSIIADPGASNINVGEIYTEGSVNTYTYTDSTITFIGDKNDTLNYSISGDIMTWETEKGPEYYRRVPETEIAGAIAF